VEERRMRAAARAELERAGVGGPITLRVLIPGQQKPLEQSFRKDATLADLLQWIGLQDAVCEMENVWSVMEMGTARIICFARKGGVWEGGEHKVHETLDALGLNKVSLTLKLEE
jgi:hypothetical protein